MVGEASRYIRGKRRDRNDRKTSFPLIRSETQKKRLKNAISWNSVGQSHS